MQNASTCIKQQECLLLLNKSIISARFRLQNIIIYSDCLMIVSFVNNNTSSCLAYLDCNIIKTVCIICV